ncbi:Repetin [Streptomyces sp. ME01-18a]|uniref:Repetin n=1 Tax=Streptomyces sp. ME01-18a TaxID=3028669 RepID=UPI0029BB8708|nr:Repetin [Streptomyces sp. ME01-18a]MDX3433946.1 Repetin [Streptomyces sp. ME01-18a]
MKRIVEKPMRTAVSLAALLLACATGSANAATGESTKEFLREAAGLSGTAKLYRSAGDDITFSFDAKLAAKDKSNPLNATGTFRFSHYQGDWGGSAHAKVDCLITGGNVAVVSGVITSAEGGLADAVGKRVGITVHDSGKKDRLGYSWAAIGLPQNTPDDMPKCVSSAPFEKVKSGTGDFRVRAWHPQL